MREMMDSQLAKQRRQEMLREVERNHLVKAMRTTRRRRTGRRVALVWEMKRQAGRLFKLQLAKQCREEIETGEQLRRTKHG